MARQGLWTGLVRRAISDYEAGRVTVITVGDDAEYRRMRAGISEPVRQSPYRALPTVVLEASGTMRVYLQLERKDGRVEERNNGHPRRPAMSGIRPIRK